METNTKAKDKETVCHLAGCCVHRSDDIPVVAASGKESSREVPKTKESTNYAYSARNTETAGNNVSAIRFESTNLGRYR